MSSRTVSFMNPFPSMNDSISSGVGTCHLLKSCISWNFFEAFLNSGLAFRLIFDGSALIGRHTRIDEYTKIKDSNIDNFCIIGNNVTIENSAIMDAAKIGDYTQVSNSILGRKVIVESSKKNPTRIHSTSVIGNSVQIMEGCDIRSTKINPGLIIPRNMRYRNEFLHNYEDVVKLAI